MPTSQFAAPLGVPIFRWFDDNGNPAAAWQLGTYVAGTNTPLATYPTYTDALAGTNANADPVVLDADGTKQVWVQTSSYKFVMMLPVALGSAVKFTQDNVAAAIGFPGAFLQSWIPETNGLQYVSANAFSVLAADVTSIYHIGRRVRLVCSGGTRYADVTSSAFGVATLVGVAIDGGLALDAGLSAAAYGIEPYANPSYLSPRTAFTARLTANQTGFGASTKLAGWTVERDRLAEWDAANNRLVVQHPGDYLVQLQTEFSDTVANAAVTLQIARAGAVVAQSAQRASPTAGQIWTCSCQTIVTTTLGAAFIEAFIFGTANTTAYGTIGTRLTITRIS